MSDANQLQPRIRIAYPMPSAAFKLKFPPQDQIFSLTSTPPTSAAQGLRLVMPFRSLKAQKAGLPSHVEGS